MNHSHQDSSVHILKKHRFLELAGEFSSPRDAISTILNDQVDIVFLDIQMPQLNGIEFARIIPSETRIIFTTAYSDYAVEADFVSTRSTICSSR